MNSDRLNNRLSDRLHNSGFSDTQLLRRETIVTLQGAVMFVILFAMLVSTGQIAWAQTESVVYTFCSLSECADGGLPNSGLILDAQGNLYGETLLGGTHGEGIAFEMTPSGTETILQNFNGALGEDPGGGLTWGAKGNLYGTTSGGGPSLGTVFELKPRSFRYLYRFKEENEANGGFPGGNLVMDAQGNLYGATAAGGAFGGGTVFKVTPDGTETVLYSFAGGMDGFLPSGGLIFDAGGNLYGATLYGGGGDCANGDGCGTVFKLSPNGTETVLHSFTGTDGEQPNGDLVLDGEGNLYGTTYAGGGGSGCLDDLGCGTVFKVTPSGATTVLYRFAGGTDGGNPLAGLVLDGGGNFYGTTVEGGGSACYGEGCGTVFKMTRGGNETVLYRFAGGTDGAGPANDLVLDAQGNFYGTAGGGFSQYCPYNGGACGVMFKVTP